MFVLVAAHIRGLAVIVVRVVRTNVRRGDAPLVLLLPGQSGYCHVNAASCNVASESHAAAAAAAVCRFVSTCCRRAAVPCSRTHAHTHTHPSDFVVSSRAEFVGSSRAAHVKLSQSCRAMLYSCSDVSACLAACFLYLIYFTQKL